MIGKVHHLRPVAGKESSVSVSGAERSLPNEDTESVLQPVVRIDSVEHLGQKRVGEDVSFINELCPASEGHRGRGETTPGPFQLRVDDELAVHERFRRRARRAGRGRGPDSPS